MFDRGNLRDSVPGNTGDVIDKRIYRLFTRARQPIARPTKSHGAPLLIACARGNDSGKRIPLNGKFSAARRVRAP